MKKKYLIPEIEIITFVIDDIILTSGGEDDDDIGSGSMGDIPIKPYL